jgi:hypothetical protein
MCLNTTRGMTQSPFRLSAAASGPACAQLRFRAGAAGTATPGSFPRTTPSPPTPRRPCLSSSGQARINGRARTNHTRAWGDLKKEPRASSVTPPEVMDEAAFHAARDALVTDIVQVCGRACSRGVQCRHLAPRSLRDNGRGRSRCAH